MKLTSILMLTAGIIVTGAFVNSRGYAQLSKDDVKWINQCIADNKGQPGGTPDIVRKYCMCMNEEMDDNETRYRHPVRESQSEDPRQVRQAIGLEVSTASTFRLGERQARPAARFFALAPAAD